MQKITRFGVSIDQKLLEHFDEKISSEGYLNRSEAIRDLIREKLIQEEWQAPAGETFGIAFLVYDHEALSLDRRLTDTQHDHIAHIVSTLHVHIDESNCVEVVMLKGPGKTIRAIGEKLVSMRGIKYGKLTMGTTGQQVR